MMLKLFEKHFKLNLFGKHFKRKNFSVCFLSRLQGTCKSISLQFLQKTTPVIYIKCKKNSKQLFFYWKCKINHPWSFTWKFWAEKKNTHFTILQFLKEKQTNPKYIFTFFWWFFIQRKRKREFLERFECKWRCHSR